LKENDILDSFLSESSQKKEEQENPKVIFQNATRAHIISKEDKEKAQKKALELLEETRVAFDNLQSLMIEINTFNILFPSIQGFGEYAYEINEFIKNFFTMTREEYEDTELNEFLLYDSAVTIVNSFLIKVYEEYIKDDKDKNDE